MAKNAKSACSTRSAPILLSAALALAAGFSVSTAQAQDGAYLQKLKAAASSREGTELTAYVTGYSYWDNTPPGSAAIAFPVIHSTAGGNGSYSNPITLAVGHSLQGGRHTLDLPAGTHLYLKRLKKYAIVEDVCGDGPTPQNGPCHTGRSGHPWFDLYVGGQRSTRGTSNACSSRITALQPVIINPRHDLPTVTGELTASGCRVF
jgi:hypothetical protein